MKNFCPCTGPLIEYGYNKRDSIQIDKIKSHELDDWRECWHNLRVAVGGSKVVKQNAYNLDWLELPEHIQYKLHYGDHREREMAQKSAEAYYKRTPFDQSVKVARSITLGSVFRIDTEREGLDETERGFNIGVLDEAEIELGNWGKTERFLLKERLTTGYLASYVFLREDTAEPTVKHYCAENIVYVSFDSMGNLEFILFKEVVENQERFSDDDDEYIYCELSLDDGVFVKRTWRSQNGDEFEASEADETLVVLRNETLREIPVVILGGPYPSAPPFEPLFEKTRELFQINAQIKYREHKISHPALRINYEDTPKLSYVCSPGETRGRGSEAYSDDDKDENGPPVIVPGLALETQKATVSYLYDTGEGLTFLFQEREAAQNDLQSLGGNYGVTYSSNIAEGTERMRQGRENAFIVNYVIETSEALTALARWIAFFWGITDETRLNQIKISLNTVLSDEGPQFTLIEVRDLLVSGTIDEIIAIRMLQLLLPNQVFGEDTTAEEILQRIQSAQFGESPEDIAAL